MFDWISKLGEFLAPSAAAPSFGASFGGDLLSGLGFGGTSGITEHLAAVPDLARSMRYLPSLAFDQGMQDYLGPLAAQDFAREAVKVGDFGGQLATAGTPLYTAAKAASPRLMSRLTGTGGALPSLNAGGQIGRAYRGLLGF